MIIKEFLEMYLIYIYIYIYTCAYDSTIDLAQGSTHDQVVIF